MLTSLQLRSPCPSPNLLQGPQGALRLLWNLRVPYEVTPQAWFESTTAHVSADLTLLHSVQIAPERWLVDGQDTFII